jgi:hypothetical protein
MENRIMSALEEAVAALRQAVDDANSRFQVAGDVQAAVQAVRERYDALVASENVEDEQQNQQLAEAKAETDRLLGEINSAASALTQVTEQVNTLGQTATAESSDGGTTPPAEGDTPADAGTPEASQIETTSPNDDTTATMTEVQPDAPTPGDTPADVGTGTAPADADAAGTSDATPTDTGAAEGQVAENPTPSASPVDNAADNPNTSSDPTDVSNMRPNL